MRLLIRICVVLALLWCGWWWLAATLVSGGIDDWLAARRAEGWDAQVQETRASGFPLRVATRLEGITVAAPAGIAVEADRIGISFPTYWPGNVTLSLPDTPVTLRTPAGAFFLKAKEGRASVNLDPGPALELEQVTADAGPWQLNGQGGNLMSAESLQAAATRSKREDAVYEVTLDAEGFAPGDLLRRSLALAEDWPRTFDTLLADLDIRLDRPLDMRSLETEPVQVRAVTIRQIDLAWGDLRFAASGTVEIDAEGVPDGTIALRLDNWRTAVAQAERAGIVTAQARGQAEVILNALANMGGSTETLALDVRFAQGEMYLGQIRLGPAPRLSYLQ